MISNKRIASAFSKFGIVLLLFSIFSVGLVAVPAKTYAGNTKATVWACLDTLTDPAQILAYNNAIKWDGVHVTAKLQTTSTPRTLSDVWLATKPIQSQGPNGLSVCWASPIDFDFNAGQMTLTASYYISTTKTSPTVPSDMKLINTKSQDYIYPKKPSGDLEFDFSPKIVTDSGGTTIVDSATTSSYKNFIQGTIYFNNTSTVLPAMDVKVYQLDTKGNRKAEVLLWPGTTKENRDLGINGKTDGTGNFITQPDLTPGDYDVEVNYDYETWLADNKWTAVGSVGAVAAVAICVAIPGCGIAAGIAGAVTAVGAGVLADLPGKVKDSVEGKPMIVGVQRVTLNSDGTTTPYPVALITSVQTISPMMEAVANAVRWMADGISWALKTCVGVTNQLLFQTKTYVLGAGVASSWIKIRNISLILLVLALVIIAFANVFQIDIEQYGLNRMIPKIIISIIMAYFSWLIVVFFFDFAGAIQSEAISIINGQTSALAQLGNLNIGAPSTIELVSAIGAFFVAIAIMVIALFSMVVLVFSLFIRIIFLSFLLAIAPLAFIMNIMPFTENLYKQWWSEFWKWMFMGPMAVAIIALGTVIALPSATSGSTGLSSTLNQTAISSVETVTKLGILAAAIYFAGTLPLQWGGKIMAGWQKAGKSFWGKTGGAAIGLAGKGFKAGGKSLWSATGVPNAFGLAKSKMNYLADKNAKIQGNKLAQGLSFGKLGMSDVAMKQSIEDAEAQTYAKEFKAASLNEAQLRDVTSKSKGPRAMAAWQLMAEKDWLKEDDLGNMYGHMGVERGDNLIWGNRKKHPTWYKSIDTAREGAWKGTHPKDEYVPNEQFATEKLMSKLGEAEIQDIEANALKDETVAKNLRLTERAAETLKSEQIDAMTGGAEATKSLKARLNAPNTNGKSFRDGLFAAVDAKDSGAIKANLEAVRKVGGASIQHLDDQSLLSLVKKRF